MINKPLAQFLEEDVNESLHEMIRTNVITATRNFQQRVDAFKREILFGKNSSMKIKNISYRVEFQGRGAAHIHGTLWLDIKEICKSLEFTEEMNKKGIVRGELQLSQAFSKLRNNTSLSDTDKSILVTLTNMFISCSLDPKNDNEEVIKIAHEVNYHHHTKKCQRYQQKCRYELSEIPFEGNHCC